MSDIEKFKNKHPDWKFDKSLGQNGKYERNEKTYHWCTGPGHFKVGMWAVHKAGACTGNASGSQDKSKDKSSENKSAGKSNKMSKAAYTTYVTEKLQADGYGDDVSALVNDIVSKMY